MRISSFPKIFAIGTDYIKDIFDGPVEITEKIDGSQFVFGRVDGELWIRSKGAQLFFENHQKMFSKAISYIDEISNNIPDGKIFFCEYLQKPKHNTLVYDRTPLNNLILFAVMNLDQTFDQDLEYNSEMLNIEKVPVIYSGEIKDMSDLNALLDRKSVLGGAKIEGIVVKNYAKPFLLGGQPIPVMAGKFVSEEFKEVHQARWKNEESGKSKIDIFFEGFRTDARWEKAVQHLRENGTLTNEPKDIGNLIKEIRSDIEAEEKENVKEFLWKEFSGQLLRKSTAGMPEWYKKKLAERSFI